MRIFVIYIFILIYCLGDEINIGEVSILSGDVDFNKYMYIRKEIVHDIFMDLHHPSNLNYTVQNPFEYDGSGDVTGLGNYLCGNVQVNVAIIFACETVPDEVVTLIKSLNIHFFAFSRKSLSFSSSLYFMSQPNAVYMTSIAPLCLVYKKIHVWVDDNSVNIFNNFIEPQLTQYDIEFDVFNSSELLSSEYQQSLQDAQIKTSSSSVSRTSNVIINLLPFSNSNIQLLNDIIDRGNLNNWNLYNIGNCDTRDLYYLNNPDSNHIYCVSTMMNSDLMIDEVKSKIPNHIVDDVSMSLYNNNNNIYIHTFIFMYRYYMHFILDSIYQQYKSLYIYKLSILKDIIASVTKATQYGEYKLLDSQYIYKSISITTLNKVTNETVFDKFQAVDPTLQPTDYHLSTQLVDVLYNSKGIIVEANVIRVGLLFNIHCFTGKVNILTREAIEYAIFRTNYNIYGKDRKLRLFYYSLTFSNETDFREKLNTLVNVYHCNIIFFNENGTYRRLLIKTLLNKKVLAIQIAPQEGATNDPFVYYAGHTIFALLDSLRYQRLLYNPIIVYDESNYAYESILNIMIYRKNYEFSTRSFIYLDIITADTVRENLTEFLDGGGTILLIMEQDNSVEFMKCLFPINQQHKFVVFSTTLDEMVVKEDLTNQEYDGIYLFGYYFSKADRFTDFNFEDTLNERYYKSIEVYNNFIFPYYITKLVGNVIESIGVNNISSLHVLLKHKIIEGITGTIVYNSDNYLLSNINVLKLAANNDDSVVYGGKYVIMNPPYYPFFEAGYQFTYINDEEEVILSKMEICFNLIILDEVKYKETLEFLTAMVNYISLYHGVNECLFVPYVLGKDYTNKDEELFEDVEDFIVKHHVITIYSSEDVDQLNLLIPIADYYHVPIYVGFDTGSIVCSNDVFYFGAYKSTYGPIAYMKNMLIFGDVFIVLQEGNTFWNSAAENVKEFKRTIKEEHIDDREIECCKDHTMEEVVDYIHQKMPNGGLIYTFFDSEEFKEMLRLIYSKNLVGYSVTTLNDYRFDNISTDPILFRNTVFMGTYPYFDNVKPMSEFTTFIREMGIYYNRLTYAEVSTMTSFFNSIIFKRVTLSKLDTLDNQQIYSVLYSTKFTSFVDGISYIGKNNFISKNWFISKFDGREIISIIAEALPFPQIKIPFNDVRCDCTEEKIMLNVKQHKVAVQKYNEPFPSHTFLLFYESALMLYYSSYDILADGEVISEYVFDGNSKLESIIDDMIQSNVRHIFVFDYKYEIKKELNAIFKRNDILLWNIKLNHEERECFSNMYFYIIIILLLLFIIINRITIGPNIYQIIDPSISYWNTQNVNDLVLVFNSLNSFSLAIKEYCMKNLQFIGVTVKSYLDVSNILLSEETYTYAILDHILTNMPSGGLVLLSLTPDEVKYIKVNREVFSAIENHIFLLTDVSALNYIQPLPNVYAITHYSPSADTLENRKFMLWVEGMLGKGNFDIAKHELLYTAIMMLDVITKMVFSYLPVNILPLFDGMHQLSFPHGESYLLKQRLLSYSNYLLKLKTTGDVYTKIELRGPYNASNLIAQGNYSGCYGVDDIDENEETQEKKNVYEIGYAYCSKTVNAFQSLLISMFLLPIHSYNRGKLINDTYIDIVLFPISVSETAEEWENVEQKIREKDIHFLFGYRCNSGRLPQFDDVISMNIETVFESEYNIKNQFSFDVYMKALIPFCSRWIVHNCYSPVYILTGSQPYVRQTALLFKQQLLEYGYTVYQIFRIEKDSDLDNVNRAMFNHFIYYDGTVISLLNDEYLYNFLRSLNKYNSPNLNVVHFGHYNEEVIETYEDLKFEGTIFFFAISHSDLETPVFKMLSSNMKLYFNTTSNQLSQYSINIYNSALFFVEGLKKANLFNKDLIVNGIRSVTVETATGLQSIGRNNFMTQNIYILYASSLSKDMELMLLYSSVQPFTMTISYETTAMISFSDMDIAVIEVLLLHSFSSLAASHDYYVGVAEMALFDYFNENSNTNIRIMYHVYDCKDDYLRCFIDGLYLYHCNYIFAGNATLDMNIISKEIGDDKILYFEGHFVGSCCLNNIIIGGGLPNQIFTTPINFFLNKGYLDYHIFYSSFEPYKSFKNVLVSILDSNYIYNVSCLRSSVDYIYLEKYFFANAKVRVLIFLCPSDLFVSIVNMLAEKNWNFDKYPIFTPFFDSTQKILVMTNNFYFLGHSGMDDDKDFSLYKMLVQYGAISKLSLREIIAYGTITLFLYQIQMTYRETNEIATPKQLFIRTMDDDITIMDGLKYSKQNSPNWIFQIAQMKSQFNFDIITNYNEWIMPEIFNMYHEPGYRCYFNGSKLEKQEYVLLNVLLIYNNTPNMIDILDMTVNELNEEFFPKSTYKIGTREFNFFALNTSKEIEDAMDVENTFAVFFAGDYNSLYDERFKILELCEKKEKLIFFVSPSSGEACHHNIFYAGIYSHMSYRMLASMFNLNHNPLKESYYILYTQTDGLEVRAFYRLLKSRYLNIKYVACHRGDNYAQYAENDAKEFQYFSVLNLIMDLHFEDLEEYYDKLEKMNTDFMKYYFDMRVDNRNDMSKSHFKEFSFVRSYNTSSTNIKVFSEKVANRIPYSLFVTADMVHLYYSVNIYIRALLTLTDYNLQDLREAIYRTVYYQSDAIESSEGIRFNTNHHMTHDLFLYYNQDGKGYKIINSMHNLSPSPYFPGVNYELDNVFCDWSFDKEHGDVLYHSPTIPIALVVPFTGKRGAKGRMIYEILSGFIHYYLDTSPSYPYFHLLIYDSESSDEVFTRIVKKLLEEDEVKIYVGGLRLEEKNIFINLVDETDSKDVIFYFLSLSSGFICSDNVISLGPSFNQLKQMFILHTTTFDGLVFVVHNEAQFSIELTNFMIKSLVSYGYKVGRTIQVPLCTKITDMDTEVLRQFQIIDTLCANTECIIYFAFLNCVEEIIKELEVNHFLDNENITLYTNYLDETTMRANKYSGKSPIYTITPSFSLLQSSMYSHLTAKTELIADIVDSLFGNFLSISAVVDTAYIVIQLLLYAYQYSDNSISQYLFYKEESGISLYTHGGYIKIDTDLYLERYLYMVRVDYDGTFLSEFVSPDISIPDHYTNSLNSDIADHICDVTDGGNRGYVTIPLIYNGENRSSSSPRLLTLYAEIYFQRFNYRYTLSEYYIVNPIYRIEDLKNDYIKTSIENDKSLFCFIGCSSVPCRDSVLMYLDRWKKLLFYTGESGDNKCDEQLITLASTVYQKTRFLLNYFRENDFDYYVILYSKTDYGNTKKDIIMDLMHKEFKVKIPILALIFDPANATYSMKNLTDYLDRYIQKQLLIFNVLACSQVRIFNPLFRKKEYNTYKFRHIYYNLDVYALPKEVVSSFYNLYIVSSYMSDISTTDTMGFEPDVDKLIGKKNLNEGIELVYSAMLLAISVMQYQNEMYSRGSYTIRHILMTIQNKTINLPSGRAILRSNNYMARSTFLYRMSDSGESQLVFPASSNISFLEPLDFKDCNFGPYYKVYEYPDSLLGTTLIIAIGETLMLIFICVILVKNRNKPTVRRSSLNFLVVAMIALWIIIASTFAIIEVPTNVWICRFRVWGIGNGIILLYAVLITKCWRLKALFRNPALKKRTITNRFLSQIVLVILGLHIIFNTVWEVSAPTKVVITDITTTDITLHRNLYQCESNVTFEYIIILYFKSNRIIDICIIVMLLLYGIIISWESRDIQKEFNQSIMLSLSIGTILFIGAVTIPFDFALFKDSISGVVWFRMLMILGGVLIETLIIYIPKFYDFYENNGSGEGSSSDTIPTQEQVEKQMDVDTHEAITLQNAQVVGSAFAHMLSVTTSNKITTPQATSQYAFVSPMKVFSYKDIKSPKNDVNYVVTKTPHSSRRINPYNPNNTSPTRLNSHQNILSSGRQMSRQNSTHESTNSARTVSSSYTKFRNSTVTNISNSKTPQLESKTPQLDPIENFKLEPTNTSTTVTSNF